MAGRVFQVVECLREGDGVSLIARLFTPLLAELGCEPLIVSRTADETTRGESFPLASVDWRADDAIILHVHGLSELESFLATFPGQKAIYFHNITPSSFFEPGSGLWQYTRDGWDQLDRIAKMSDLWLAPSVFNLRALEHVDESPRPASVVPPLLSNALDGTQPTNRRLLDALRACGETNFLFVGRLTPNKRQDLVMEVFDYYHTRVDRRSRLHLVGDPSFDRGYVRALEARREELASGRSIELTGRVDAPALDAHFRGAHLFLCLSEHEGVCLPALDAMRYGVPVVARAVAALPETLGEGAVLLHGCDPPRIAELCALVLNDGTLRERLGDSARQNLDRYSRPVVERAWSLALSKLRGSATASTGHNRAS